MAVKLHRDRYIIQSPDGPSAVEKVLGDVHASVGHNGLESTAFKPHCRPDLWVVELLYDKEKRTEWN